MNNRIIRKAIFILLPVTVWICFYCIFHDELSAGVTPVFTLLISFASVLSIAGLFYLLYSITNDTLKDARQEAELLALNQQQKLKEQQNQTLASRRQQTLSLQENVQRDLHTYETLMDNGQYEEAARCLEKLTSTFQKERFHPICQDSLINAILADKRFLAMQKNIKVTYEVLLPEKSNIPSSELSSIFFNLLDNGIESCNASGSEAPFISVTSKMSAGFLTVHMQNSKDPARPFNHKTSKKRYPQPWIRPVHN